MLFIFLFNYFFERIAKKKTKTKNNTKKIYTNRLKIKIHQIENLNLNQNCTLLETNLTHIDNR